MTISEIARRANVCCATVSRVINNSGPVKAETREKVEAIINQYQFSPHSQSKALKKNEKNTIAVIVPDISNPYFCNAIKGISREADLNYFDMIFYDTDENQEKEILILKKIKAQIIKGLIIAPTTDTNEFNGEYLKLLESMGIPIFLMDRDVKYSNFDGVFLDNIKGAFDATCALLKEGHRRIALISGPKTSKPGRDRLHGFQKAFLMNQLEIDEDLIFTGNFRMESGYELTNKILSMEPRPTAIFAANNQMGLGALKSIKEHNLEIPNDISFIIFGQIDAFNILGLNISNVSTPDFEMGQIAVQNLMQKIQNKANKMDNQVTRKTLIPQLNLKGSEKLVE